MASTAQWYMAIGGQQVGPVSEQDVIDAIQGGSVDAETLVFVAGMQNWTPLREVKHFQAQLRPAAAAAPAVPAQAAGGFAATAGTGARTAHEID